MSTLDIAPGVTIDENELEMTFIRASGPGGQNVNKVATAVQLKFDPGRSPGVPAAVCRRLVMLAGRRASREGVITLTAQKHRSQERNRRDAVERLIELVREAARPIKARRPTRPTASSRLRRLEAKRRRGDIKRHRGGKLDFT